MRSECLVSLELIERDSGNPTRALWGASMVIADRLKLSATGKRTDHNSTTEASG